MVSNPSSVGRDPWREFPETSRYIRDVREPSSVGMAPVSALLDNTRLVVSMVNRPSSEGRGPESWLSLRSSADTTGGEVVGEHVVPYQLFVHGEPTPHLAERAHVGPARAPYMVSSMSSSLIQFVGVGVGWGEGSGVGSAEGAGVGSGVGETEGNGVGHAEGLGEGTGVGCVVGTAEGSVDGRVVGRCVGPGVGTAVGTDDDGPMVGATVGKGVGSAVGRGEGGTQGVPRAVPLAYMCLEGFGFWMAAGISSQRPELFRRSKTPCIGRCSSSAGRLPVKELWARSRFFSSERCPKNVGRVELSRFCPRSRVLVRPVRKATWVGRVPVRRLSNA